MSREDARAEATLLLDFFSMMRDMLGSTPLDRQRLLDYPAPEVDPLREAWRKRTQRS